MAAAAGLKIPLPETLDAEGDTRLADKWLVWYKRFARYRISSGLHTCPDNEQVSTLLYTMGKCADAIITQLRINEETITYDQLKTALDEYFGTRTNILTTRAKFNRRVQLQGESVETFIQDLYTLADQCNYGDLRDELIRDRIIVGVLDDNLSDRLQAKADLNLAQAVQLARQAETRQQDREIVRGQLQNTNTVVKGIDAIKLHTTQTAAQKSTTPDKCKWCAGQKHPRKKCPARNETCYKCRKKGHFSSACLSVPQNVGEIGRSDNELSDSESQFLGEITNPDDFWEAQLSVNEHPVKFKLDSGSKATVLNGKLPFLQTLKLDPIPADGRPFEGPGSTPLSMKGQITDARVKLNDKSVCENVYVMENQKHNLLSKRACHLLGLLTPSADVYSVTSTGNPDFRSEYPRLFTGLGKFGTPYHITLKEDAQPLSLYTPRRVAHPLLAKLKAEIQRIEKQGVISPVTEPTDWCAGLVPVVKPSGALRLCVDLSQLNKAVKREVHPMASVQDSLSSLSVGKPNVFSKLDANSGFWQIPLDKDSRLLTTFITPFGRYCFNRLPFGISSASEVFQRNISVILEKCEGVVCHMDDILIYGSTTEEHNARVRVVLDKLQTAGVTLNDKCEFNKREIKFLGHLIDSNGIRADPSKTEAIRDMEAPKSVHDVRRFNGMVNQLCKFVPKLASVIEPIRHLLKKDNDWYWGPNQQTAFDQIKSLLVSPEALAHYDLTHPTIVASDASNQGLGAVLLQVQPDGQRRPVCYASRSLSDVESRYAVIEKEALAVTWACEQFHAYLQGREFSVETDHKPLIQLLDDKDLSKLPARIQRFRLRLMRYNPRVTYVRGIHQHIPDTLSRAPVKSPIQADYILSNDADAMAETAVSVLPVSDRRLSEIREAQKADTVCSEVRGFVIDGWPAYMPHTPILFPYWENRQHFTIVKDVLLFDDRIVIPHTLRLDMLRLLHEGHLGITKCRTRARSSVWWPGLSKEIEQTVAQCHTCAKVRPEPKEPLMPSSFPSRAWERLGMDLFHFEGKNYLLVVDYYSRWIEFRILGSTTSDSVIKAIRDIFSVHGIPDLVISDNGPQFACQTFKDFTVDYGFTHVTSSPLYPRANGEAERAVRTIKDLMKKNTDLPNALMILRSTSLDNGLSPAQLLMGRTLKTKLPIMTKNLMGGVEPDSLSKAQHRELNRREHTRQNHDTRHRTKELPTLQEGERVYLRDQNSYGTVIKRADTPRSYVVETESGGSVRRNRSALVSKDPEQQAVTETTPPVTKPVHQDTSTTNNGTVTRSGRTSRPPTRLISE